MKKVEVEISEAHYRILREVADRLELSVKDLLQQEVNEALANIEIWYERFSQ